MKLFATIAAATIATAGAASAVTIDFDSGVAIFDGDNNLVGYEQDGYEFEIWQTSIRGEASNGANLFDTSGADCGTLASCEGNDDGDLLWAPQDVVSGNVIIRQDAGADLDDDSSGVGNVFFKLIAGSAFTVESYSGIDGRFNLRDGSGWTGWLGSLDNNMVGTKEVGSGAVVTLGSSFRIRYDGSGGIDNIVLAPVPLPATALLLLASVAGLGAARRRS